MPVIPAVNEQQVLNPSSPVPVSSPEEERLLGNATANFGSALSDLGAVLLKEKKKNDALEAERLLGESEIELNDEVAARRNAPVVQDDKDGTGQSKQFVAGMRERTKEMAETIGDPDIRRIFEAKVIGRIADSQKTVLSNEALKLADKNKSDLNGVIVKKMEVAAKDKPSMIEYHLDDIEATIRTFSNQSGAGLDGAIKTGRSAAIENIVESYVADPKNDASFKLAQGVIDRHSKEFADPNKITELRTKIAKQRENFYDREEKRYRYEQTAQEKAIKKEWEDNSKALNTLYLDAGTNQAKIFAADAVAKKFAEKGMPTDMIENAKKSAVVFNKEQDDFQEMKIISRVMKTKNFIGETETVKKLIAEGKLSGARGKDVIDKLSRMRDFETSESRAQLNKVMSYVDTYKDKTLTDPTKGLYKMEVKAEIEKVKVRLERDVSRGMPVSQAMHRADKYLSELGYSPAGTTGRGSQDRNLPQTLDDVSKKERELKVKWDSLKQKGGLTEDIKKNFKEQYENLKIRRKNLEFKESIKDVKPQEQGKAK